MPRGRRPEAIRSGVGVAGPESRGQTTAGDAKSAMTPGAVEPAASDGGLQGAILTRCNVRGLRLPQIT